MRKLALLLAAALVISAPLIAAAPTLTHAAAKAKKPATKVAKKASPKEADPAEVNNRIARALDDLFRSLATHRHGGGDKGGKKAR